VIELNPLFVKIIIGILVAIISGLLGMLFGLFKEMNRRAIERDKASKEEIEKRLMMHVSHLKENTKHDYNNLNSEHMRLRDERHENTTHISEALGRCRLLEDTIKDLSDEIKRMNRNV